MVLGGLYAAGFLLTGHPFLGLALGALLALLLVVL